MIDPIQLTLLAAALSRPDDVLREVEHQILQQRAINPGADPPASVRRTHDGQIGPPGNASDGQVGKPIRKPMTARFSVQTGVAPMLD